MSLFSIDYRGTSLSLEIFIMTDTVFNPAVQPIPIPVRELLPWIIFGGLILLLALYCVAAGLLTFGFAKIAGAPPLTQAIAFEETAQANKGEAPGAELVSRKTQAG